ncbi:hypothetical protein TRFO_10534 [Tritrichomonas foetus]|uniref:3-beta hydroxysteroid dehydrogenase/isomerase domain-containing protein n=1 Tax=Tritrichomonas foetus TaxID=1144522 RepID=A0A1J4JDR6_9EUKA|nr:hypothetical protein TRFO_10534 [Tritrichomonas foetus]|eukprot:OHS95396.1 hypothetical protein TRFO_10534 [Tritrichomonas foetus]
MNSHHIIFLLTISNMFLFQFIHTAMCLNDVYTRPHIRPFANQNKTTFLNDQIGQNETTTKTVFITGGTGVMGSATVQEFMKYSEFIKIKLLVRKSSKNVKLMKKFSECKNVEIIWGDLLNYEDILKGVTGSDYVLHIGGMVSPMADLYPYLTRKTNVESAENIVRAVLSQPNKDDIKVCYIGSVAETGNRNYPIHWGRTGDPIKVSIYDHYGVSKVLAERVFVESGIKHWVVLRQSGILHSGLLHHMDPIIFNVPLNGVLEWCTVEDSGRLMANLVVYDNGRLPEEFWCKFYNIGSGEEYRLTNYEFESLILGSIGLGKLESIFNPNWFASKNFHGHFYLDSDVLENYLHFRENLPVLDYFTRLANKCEFFYRIPKLIPFKNLLSQFVKPFMWMIANTETMGTLSWVKSQSLSHLNHITAFFGSYEEYLSIPNDWTNFNIRKYDTSLPLSNEYRLNHGYDETKPLSQLNIKDMADAAHFRGGEIVSSSMIQGDLQTKLTWRCGHCGRTFEASPTLILLGGHWCPHCNIPHESWNYDSIAKTNPFFAQVWYTDHKFNETNVYNYQDIFNEPCYEHHEHSHHH